MYFATAEKLVIKLIVTLFFVCTGLAWSKGVKVNLQKFDLIFLFCMTFVAIGQFYRRVRIHEPLAASATVIGLSLLLSQIGVAFNYLCLPYSYFGFDQQLAQWDATMGYVWRDVALTFVNYPGVVKALRLVYNSSLIQIIIIILLLGVAAQVRDLHRYMLILVIGLLTCMSIWAILPSSTPVGFQPLPVDVAARLNLAVDASTGAELQRLAKEGVSFYPPPNFEGMIGFPSFHTVMLVATVYVAYNIRFVFLPVLLWNLAMFPAILLIGAHNLVDVFGGLAVVAFSIWCAGKIMSVKQTNSRWQNRAESGKLDLVLQNSTTLPPSKVTRRSIRLASS